MTNRIASLVSSTTTFRRLAITGLVASALLGSAVAPVHASACYFGQCGQAPAAKSDFKVIARHGSWTAKTNGTTTFVTNRFSDGSEMTIVDKDQKLYIAFSYDGWHWKEGKKFPVKIDIDGDVYNGTSEAMSGTMLLSDSVKGSFIKTLFSGRKAKFEIAGDTFTISTLSDGAATIDDAVKFQRSASR